MGNGKNKGQAEVEYDKLIGFAKWISSVVLLAISIVGGFVAYSTYNSVSALKSDLESQAQEINDKRQAEFEQKFQLAQDRVDAIYENAQREIDFVERKALAYAQIEIERKISSVLSEEDIITVTEKIIDYKVKPILDASIEKQVESKLGRIEAEILLTPLVVESGRSSSALSRLADSSYLSKSEDVREVARIHALQIGARYVAGNSNWRDLNIYSIIQNLLENDVKCIAPESVIDSTLRMNYNVSNGNDSKYKTLRRWYDLYGLVPYDFKCYSNLYRRKLQLQERL